MPGKRKKEEAFFDELCRTYYQRVLLYLYGALHEEQAARDCVQEVFLTAYAKRALLAQHPNPGGFLFQAAKNLSKKARRESFARMVRELSADDAQPELVDAGGVEQALDAQIDERDYIESVLSRLPEDKRRLYDQYYVRQQSMADIAAALGLEEPALRMRFVRLRRDIRKIIGELSEQYFIC